MDNNDVLRKLRYAFDFGDDQMIKVFSLGNREVSRTEISAWLKPEEDDSFIKLNDVRLAAFLNGLIVLKRGKKDDKEIPNEKNLNNNIILRKLKIALNLNDEAMLDILEKGQITLSKHELSAFFRNPNKSQYRECLDQVMRNFLYGMHATYRP